MSQTYCCPKCKSVVNPDETIMLIVSQPGTGVQVLVGFHPQPGNYTTYVPTGFEFVKGVYYDYFCPLCRQNLLEQQKEKMSGLHIRQGEKTQTVLFSNIHGECNTRILE